ncbi:hypothetical protein, partial [Roseateles sp. P5_E11]
LADGFEVVLGDAAATCEREADLAIDDGGSERIHMETGKLQSEGVLPSKSMSKPERSAQAVGRD